MSEQTNSMAEEAGELRVEIVRLRARVEEEHELYLAAHRDNMRGAVLLAEANARVGELEDMETYYKNELSHSGDLLSEANAKVRQYEMILDPDANFGTELIKRAELAEAQATAEHELYLTAHRDNMKGALLLVEANVRVEALEKELKDADDRIRELLKTAIDWEVASKSLEKRLVEAGVQVAVMREALEKIACLEADKRWRDLAFVARRALNSAQL